MEILDRLEHLDLAVIPAKMELQVPKVLPVLLVPMANVVLLVLLDLVAFRFGRLNSALLFLCSLVLGFGRLFLLGIICTV